MSRRCNAIKVPIWHPHPNENSDLIWLIIPEPIHKRCQKNLLNAIIEEQRWALHL